MKPIIAFAGFTLLIITSIFSQSPPLWGELRPGPFSVGFKDTVVLKQDETITFQNTEYTKPFLISIWYPVELEEAPKAMLYKEYWNFPAPSEVEPLTKKMAELYSHSLESYGVCTNVNTWKTSKFGRKQQKIYQQIMDSPVYASRGLSPGKKKYPCLIYHHGAGGTNEENSVYCEYLASQGWVVISSNFHWPVDYEGVIGQGCSYSDKAFNTSTDILFVSDFARKLPYVNEKQLVYSGHSWGGQLSFYMNSNPRNPFKLFLLYDTTLEGKSRAYIKKYAPSLDSVWVHHKETMTTPTVVFTSQTKYLGGFPRYKVTERNPSFEFFRDLSHTPLIFITCKRSIDHSNFISQGVYRANFAGDIKQRDGDALAGEFIRYQHVLTMTKHVLAGFLNPGKDEGWRSEYQSEFSMEEPQFSH